MLQLQNSHKEIQRLKSKDDNITPATQTSTKSLVIGDSVLRDFEATDANKLEVRSLSGATFISIKDTLKLYESDNKRYDNIYIIAGTNDCSKQSSTASIINAAGEVFNQAKKISNNILFSSITPRTDSGPANLKIQNVNLSLKNLCSQSNVKFIDNDGTFLTSDKSPNDALLLDGLHLNDRGTTKLITNLGIKASPKKRRPKQLGSITITISHPYYLQIITKLYLALMDHRTIHLKNLNILHPLAIIFLDGTNKFHGQINNELPGLNQCSLGIRHHLDGTRIPLSETILRCL